MPPGSMPGGNRFGAADANRFKYPAQDERTAKGRKRKEPAKCDVFAEGHLNIEDRKDDDLRQQGNGKADHHIRDGLNQ
jgi:hypothetical protein